LCASLVSLGHCVGAEARCNWYLVDINIFPYQKNLISIVTGNEFRCFTPTNLKIEFKSFRKKVKEK
jgi:hypothetical protein